VQGEKVVPTVPNPESQDATKSVFALFDKVAPEKYTKQRSQVTPETQPKTAEVPPAPVTPPAETPEQPPEPQPKPVEEHRLPSFLEKALELPQVKPAETVKPPAVDEWPEEMPAVAADQQRENYKKWRKEYRDLKDKVALLESRPTLDEMTSKKLSFLEGRNKELESVANRMSVEGHAEFQNNIIRPMTAAWNEAAGVLKAVGGDPEQLADALRMAPKDQFRAIDQVLVDIPESAKARINGALATYQQKDGQRRAWLANLPKTMEHLKKQDTQRQYAFLENQKKEMTAMFDQAVARLRDEARVEILQRSNDPEAKWWNDQADQIESVGRSVFVDNTDLNKMAYACALAPMADIYRKMWLQSREELSKRDKIISDHYASEPTISDSGGNITGMPNMQEDLKKPFADVFLRELRKAASR
jgi:outer membrane biosynthesis protein TonB